MFYIVAALLLSIPLITAPLLPLFYENVDDSGIAKVFVVVVAILMTTLLIAVTSLYAGLATSLALGEATDHPLAWKDAALHSLARVAHTSVIVALAALTWVGLIVESHSLTSEDSTTVRLWAAVVCAVAVAILPLFFVALGIVIHEGLGGIDSLGRAIALVARRFGRASVVGLFGFAVEVLLVYAAVVSHSLWPIEAVLIPVVLLFPPTYASLAGPALYADLRAREDGLPLAQLQEKA